MRTRDQKPRTSDTEPERDLRKNKELGDEHLYADDDASTHDDQLDNRMIVRSPSADGKLHTSSTQQADPTKSDNTGIAATAS